MLYLKIFFEKYYKFLIIYNIFILLSSNYQNKNNNLLTLTILPTSCEDCGDHSYDGTSLIEIMSLEPNPVNFGQNLTIKYKFSLPNNNTSVGTILIVPQSNPGCTAYEGYTFTLSGKYDDNTASLLTSNLNSNCLFSPFTVRIYTTTNPGGNDITSATHYLTVNGIPNNNNRDYNLFYYHPTNVIPIPLGWNNMEEAFEDGNTVLIHNHQDQSFPCESFNWVGLNEYDLQEYIQSKISLYNSGNNNKGFLIGMCNVTGPNNNSLGYGLMKQAGTSGLPGAGCVYVTRINYETQGYGWDETRRNKLKNALSIHELGHARGLVHGTHDGIYKERCIMKDAFEQSNFQNIDDIINTPRFCGKHSEQLENISW